MSARKRQRKSGTPQSTDNRGKRKRGLVGPRRKLHSCNCKNSKCLKLYCECFASGIYCSDERCRCVNCCNNALNESVRARAIANTLEKNPNAFRPKIERSPHYDFSWDGAWAGKHNKGCHCKKSGCLKKYCECFQANIFCSENCKCVDCKNFEGCPEREVAIRGSNAKSRSKSGATSTAQGKHSPRARQTHGTSSETASDSGKPSTDVSAVGSGWNALKGSITHQSITELCTNMCREIVKEMKSSRRRRSRDEDESHANDDDGGDGPRTKRRRTAKTETETATTSPNESFLHCEESGAVSPRLNMRKMGGDQATFSRQESSVLNVLNAYLVQLLKSAEDRIGAMDEAVDSEAGG